MTQPVPSFIKCDTMLANELVHLTVMTIHPQVALQVRDLIGEPSFMSKSGDAAWYVSCEHGGRVIPFTLRIASTGDTYVGVGLDDQAALHSAILAIPQHLSFEVIPEATRNSSLGPSFFRRM